MYPEAVSEILVFKTNITKEEDVLRLASVMCDHAQIRHWNVDLNDIDCVLRVMSEHMDVNEVISIVQAAGFECEELPD
jgi:hypothetical protein